MANKLVSVVQSGTNQYLTPSLSFNRFATDTLYGGVVGTHGSGGSGSSTFSGSFAVNQQGVANMTVAVSSGQAYVSATPTGGTAQLFGVTSDASENVTISANSSGSTRYSFIYLKLDADKLNNPSSTALDVATLVEQVSTTNGIDSNGAPANSLLLAIVTVANGATSISASNIADRRVSAHQISGWRQITQTPTYVSATTFTVPADLTNQLAVGDKLRLRNGTSTVTYAYFYVTAVSFASSVTTVTVNGGSDYTLSNATIYDLWYSKEASPIGFPQWFNYSPTWSNLTTGNGTLNYARFQITGRKVNLGIKFTLGSTSSLAAGGPVAFSLPITGSSTSTTTASPTGQIIVQDASPAGRYPGVVIPTDTSNMGIYALNASGTYASENATSSTIPITWTTSDALAITAWYEI